MENKTIVRSLRLLGQLMELSGENPYKTKAVASAAIVIDKLPFALYEKTIEELESISGLGKATAAKVWELMQTGEMQELRTYLNNVPPGVVDLLNIKGMGPKKVLTLWKELGIETVGELLYACNENRLLKAKGFGLKTQEEVKKLIEFKMASNGRFLYARVEKKAEALLEELKKAIPAATVAFTGAYRRKCEIIDDLEVIVSCPLDEELKTLLASIPLIQHSHIEDQTLRGEIESSLKVSIHFYPQEEFASALFKTSGSTGHTNEVLRRLNNTNILFQSEEELYKQAGLPYIEPELREGTAEFKLADEKKLPALIQQHDLKGCLHNHSTWSDGVNSLEEMALYCRDVLKLEYFGISDHSKSAFYARGLSEERVLAQQEEIDALNIKLAPFRIFKGIESDILYDGSLDYQEELLATFDFVVASIHSIFRMNEQTATSRLVKAIENPYTTMLGHPTGRLLLSRSGYPVNYKTLIDACSANGVAIEINSNPLRLDLDWRWHQYCCEKNVLLSINPDAHSVAGLHDMHYGLLAARKGGLSADQCLNTFTAEQIGRYFNARRIRHYDSN